MKCWASSEEECTLHVMVATTSASLHNNSKKCYEYSRYTVAVKIFSWNMLHALDDTTFTDKVQAHNNADNHHNLAAKMMATTMRWWLPAQKNWILIYSHLLVLYLLWVVFSLSLFHSLPLSISFFLSLDERRFVFPRYSLCVCFLFCYSW